MCTGCIHICQMEPAGLTIRAERFRNVTDEYFSDVSLSFPFCGYLVFMQQRFDDLADTSIVVNMGVPDIREDPALPVSAAAGSKTPMRQPRAPPGMAFHYTVCVCVTEKLATCWQQSNCCFHPCFIVFFLCLSIHLQYTHLPTLSLSSYA